MARLHPGPLGNADHPRNYEIYDAICLRMHAKAQGLPHTDPQLTPLNPQEKMRMRKAIYNWWNNASHNHGTMHRGINHKWDQSGKTRTLDEQKKIMK